MRCGRPSIPLIAALVLAAPAGFDAENLQPVQRQRYCMGTMFEIIAYHPDRPDAERAVLRALDEIARLDGVMSHFKAESELSRLNRDGRQGFVTVSTSLFEVVEQALGFSVKSSGVFDVTIAPVLRVWKRAYALGRVPSKEELAEARLCVGYRKVELQPPNRIRLHSPCLELDLGGIGKGYAVDRALDILKADGIRHAVVNGGGSTIAGIGNPPDRTGWPVRLGASIAGRTTLLLRGQSISTSRQTMSPLAAEPASAGEIIDPRRGAPTADRATVSIVARSATVSDALSTALLLLPGEVGQRMLHEYSDVSALWISPAGGLKAAYRVSRLTLDDPR